MLIVALVLAVIGLAALVMAVVTSNELIAWVCIAASVIGVLLLIVDALRDRSKPGGDAETADAADDSGEEDAEYYPDEAPIVDEYDETDTVTEVDEAGAEDTDETRVLSDDERAAAETTDEDSSKN